MMAEKNSTSTAQELLKYSLYIGEGSVIAVVNFILVGTIAKSPILRRKKEYMIVGGLALADAWNALGYFSAGCYRSYLIATDQNQIQVTAWSCMLTVHNFFFIVGEPLSAIFLTAVSLDRLIAVSFPLKYFKFGRSYGLKLASIFYVYAICSALAGVYLSFNSPRVASYDKICFTSWAVDHKIYQTYYFFLRTIGSSLSVVLYVFVVLIYKAHGKKAAATASSSQNQNQLKSQIRLMKTLGIVSLFTFCFAVLPNGIMTIFSDQLTDAQWAALAPYTLSIANLNPLANILIYVIRHKDIRKAMAAFVTCKAPPIADIGASSHHP